MIFCYTNYRYILDNYIIYILFGDDFNENNRINR